MAKTTYRDLFGGTGEVTVLDLLAAPTRGAFSAALSCTLQAGGRVGAHQQQRDDELVICIGGDGWAEVDGVRFEMAPNLPAVWLPFGALLTLNAGAAPMHYLILKALRSPS